MAVEPSTLGYATGCSCSEGFHNRGSGRPLVMLVVGNGTTVGDGVGEGVSVISGNGSVVAGADVGGILVTSTGLVLCMVGIVVMAGAEEQDARNRKHKAKARIIFICFMIETFLLSSVNQPVILIGVPDPIALRVH